jgi:Flp pilus assembly protein TadG
MKHLRNLCKKSVPARSDSGAAAVTVAILLVGLLSFGALAVDISSLLMVRNELQNAADAGALAAARRLYIASGEAVNPGCNLVGVKAAKANTAQNVVVELTGDPSANTGDVERGHWKWSDQSFTPNSSLLATTLSEVTNAELDADNSFINAVRVKVRRETIPARSFLSEAMGFSDFSMQAEATAYIGFAGTFLPGEATDPIALCEQSLKNAQGEYSCSTGRMINSGGGDTHNTAGWTNFTQAPCATAGPPSVGPYVGCSPTPSPEITLQVGMGTTGGELQTTWDSFYNCWYASSNTDSDARPDIVKNLNLPVIDCPSNNVGTCEKLVGAANVNLIWMIRQTDPQFDWVPLKMTGDTGFPNWECPIAITNGKKAKDLNEGQFRACWGNLINHFNLVNYAGVSVADFADSELGTTMFFIPDCAAHVPIGVTAGPNLGVLAKIPVLVK